MKNGLSFISMLITLVIIGLLLAWALPQYQKTLQTRHAAELNVLQQAQQMRQQLEAQQRAREQILDNIGQ